MASTSDLRTSISDDELISAHLQVRLDQELDAFIVRKKRTLWLLGGAMAIALAALASVIGFNVLEFAELRKKVEAQQADAEKRLLETSNKAREIDGKLGAVSELLRSGEEHMRQAREARADQRAIFESSLAQIQSSRDTLLRTIDRDLEQMRASQAGTQQTVRELEQRRKEIEQLVATAERMNRNLEKASTLWNAIKSDLVTVSSSVTFSVKRGHAWLLQNREGPKEFRPSIIRLPFSRGQFVRVTFNDFTTEKRQDGREQVFVDVYYDVISDPGEPRVEARTRRVRLEQNGEPVRLEGTNHQIRADFAYLPPNPLYVFYVPDFATLSISVAPDRIEQVFAEYLQNAATPAAPL